MKGWTEAVTRRRSLVIGGLGVALGGPVLLAARARGQAQGLVLEMPEAVQNDRGFPGTLGFCLLDTGTGQVAGASSHLDEHFAMCSSFKLSLAAHVLHLAQQGRLKLDERVTYTQDFITPLGHVPATQAHLAQGMTVLELCEAAVTVSDNAAANLLLARSGGPAGLTAFWRGLGDAVTRLDDIEPALNHVPLGSLRNTTTPRAMAQTLARLLLGPTLSQPHRDLLAGWMHASTTGLKRLRAGIPADWWAGDKTGTGTPEDAPAYYVDLALLRPPGRAPLVVAAFLRSDGPRPEMDPHAETRLAAMMKEAVWAWQQGVQVRYVRDTEHR
jgi:beta-lactamase class A